MHVVDKQLRSRPHFQPVYTFSLTTLSVMRSTPYHRLQRLLICKYLGFIMVKLSWDSCINLKLYSLYMPLQQEPQKSYEL